MGAPKGNQNARKAKLGYDALHRRMVARYGSVEAGYDMIADKRLDAAEKGEAWSVQDIVHSSDGKPPQSLTVGGDPDGEAIRTENEVIFRSVRINGDRSPPEGT